MPALLRNGTVMERTSTTIARARSVLALQERYCAKSSGNSQIVIFELERPPVSQPICTYMMCRITYSGLIIQNAAKMPETAPDAPREEEMRIPRNPMLIKLTTLPITPLET